MKNKIFGLVIGAIFTVLIFVGINLIVTNYNSVVKPDIKKEIGVVKNSSEDFQKTNLATRNRIEGMLSKIIPPKTNSAFRLMIGDATVYFNVFSFVDDSRGESQELFNSEISIDKWDMSFIDNMNYKLVVKNAKVLLTEDLNKWLNYRDRTRPIKKNIVLFLIDSYGIEKARWVIVDAWPLKFDGPDFNAKGNDVEIESLEISCEGIDRVDVESDGDSNSGSDSNDND